MNTTESLAIDTSTVSTSHREDSIALPVRTVGAALAAGLLSALMGCSTTQPSLPTVDDTQRRPVNSAAALELLTCRAEAQALRLNLLDPAQGGTRGAATCSGITAPAPTPLPEANPKAGSRSSRAVFEFEVGKTELVLDETTRQVLRRSAQTADVVLVHAAGQTTSKDGESEAKAQAQATAQALVQTGIDAQKLRVSWSVAEGAQPPNTAALQTSSVVEVEFVERTARLLFSKPADPSPSAKPTQNSAPPTNSVKPAVAALDRPAKSN